MTWTEGIDYYVNDVGLVVLTERFLRERGYCCGNGCLHCPYNYARVPEPKRTELREQRERRGREGDNH